MTINNEDIQSVTQLSTLIKSAESFGVDNLQRTDTVSDVYDWMNDLLLRLRYRDLKRKEKGIVRRYLHIYSGYTMSHIDTLISKYRKVGKIIRAERTQNSFERVYTREDIALLAEVANAYNHQNGKALRKVCYDMYHLYGDMRVAKLLKKLLITQTKSRPRKSNDNGLAEGKNSAVIRKHMGHMHIPKKHAEAINNFYKVHLNPFVNFHRFSAFPEEEMLENGKIVKRYHEYKTPIQKLLSLPDVEQYLKKGVTKESLLEESQRHTHLEAAKEKERARQKLFKSFKN